MSFDAVSSAPVSALSSVDADASGFSIIQFGTPDYSDGTYDANGFLLGSFGTPDASITNSANGFLLGSFGTPSHVLEFDAATMGRIIHFGEPSTPHDVTTYADGFLIGSYGTPTALVYNNPAFVTKANGFLSIQFGTPQASWDVEADAQGFLLGSFGQPGADIGASVTGFSAMSMGTPDSVITGSADGFMVFASGEASAEGVFDAEPLQITMRFGTPTLYAKHEAVGWNLIRFEQPSSSVGEVCEASSLQLGVFGSHTSYGSYLASPLILGAFGKPTLDRGAQC